jgi:3-oxoacyl-[acyl-carrier-protein] synthase-3
MISSKITGTGSFIPSIKKENNDFLDTHFLNEDGSDFSLENDVIIEKFKNITGIAERRYAKSEYKTSDIAFFAAEKAIKDAAINAEELDYIILAHNFGDVKQGAIQGDMLPSLATRVKFRLGIENPNCVAYDILFGCPGWVEGVIQAQAFIKAGIAKKCLVIGAETLSRVVDKFDRDSMIYSDGAGACIVEETEDQASGIMSHATQTFAKDEAYFLHFGKSFNNQEDKSGIDIKEVKKIFIHQANEKMDEAIVKRFYRLFKIPVPEGVMPMTIHELGNSSVATVPTLLDLVLKGNVANQEVSKGDVIMLASVGAGMNINAIVYRF